MNYIDSRRFSFQPSTQQNRRRMSALILALTVVAFLAVQALSPHQSLADTGENADSTPGPCEDDYVAPTPVAVAVTGVPVVVTSTANDYFVLYATVPAGPDATREVPVSVTRGEAGTTTLTDRLEPLSKDKYRVEKYQVANPGDLDGDCVDDITELDGLGVYHPLNPAKKISIGDGSVVIDSHEMIETLRYKGHLENVFIKFVILDLEGGNPQVYFMNTTKHLAHQPFVDEWKPDDYHYGRTTIYGDLGYSPNVVAPDGSLGVYHFTLFRGSNYWQAHHVNELLAATMPVVRNNLAYKPNLSPRADSLEATHTDDRLVILQDSDLHPDVAFVPMNQAEGYGLLRLMEDGDDPRPVDIAIYRSLPNDLPRVAGTITTIPQTPLSHVNLRAIQNSVPNAFIRDILKDETLKALIGKHVYFAVTGEGYTLREATKKEVDDHHAAARPTATQTPERDLTVTKITALADISFNDWDAFGVKAANMAELSKLSLPAGTVPTGFAVPFYFYDEFMKNAGLADETLFGKKKWPAADKLTLPAGTKLSAVVTQILAHPRFQADYDIQDEMLDDLRDAIKDADSPDWIITALEAMHATYPDGQSLRYRSSTNNEDLPAFNGAGLYDSKTQDSDETEDDGIDKSIKAVWASLWNFRAFLEREYYRVDHTTTAMGVLVHPNYSDELANGVAVSTDPIRFLDGMYYVNTQVGEDLVTNPEPNSYPEELLLDAKGKAIVLSRSSLSKQGQLLMSDAQMLQLRNNLKTIHDRFKTLYNVQDGDDFAIEIEFKITADNKLAIKQARPWVFAPPLTLTPAVVVPNNSSTARSTKESRGIVIKLSPLVSNADVKWSMAGPDRDAFYFWVVNEKHGLYFTPQDYENPEDADGDNVYSIVLTATDPDSGGKTTIDFTVTVVNDPDDDSGDLPVLSVRPLPGIVEGGQVRFVVTADPAPAYKTAVNVRVNQDGNFLFWHSRQITVWLPTSGRATFAILTRDDKTDEPDGSVSVTLRPGVGYTVAADKGTASVRVADNDGLPSAPEVNITASQGGSEGENVTFTLTATPAPASDLAVPVTVAAGGDFGVSTGSHTVTIPTSGSATLTIATTDDDADEPDGSVTLSLTDGDGYIVGPWSTETIAVLDNDDAALVTSEVSVTSGGDITEGASAQFTVTANPAPSAPLTVNLTVGQEGQYGAVTGTQTVTVPTSGSATFTVSTTDDETHESDGSISVTVDAGGGYTVSATQGAASVVVSDNDEAPEKAEKDGAGTADVDLGEVEVGQRISYVPPSLKPAGAEDCSIGAGVLWKSVEGGEVVTSLDNGFSLDYDSGLPKLSGRAKFRAAPTVYRIEYICGSPQSWSASYTISVEVIGAGMGFDADSLGLRTLYRDQPRTVNPPQLFNAEGAVTYAVSPALPAGLSLDTATGVISGAPTTLQEQVTYTVTATDSKPGGAQTATFDVRLSVVLGMHWSTSSMPDMVFEAGERIEIVPPALVNPTTQLRYTYRATHSGVLTMHPYSGRLLASSARPMVKNTYTITAYEARVYDDRTPQRVSITVNVEVQEVHRFGAGQTVSIPAMALPGLSGTISYALAGTPALPNGLSFDSNSGVISGTLDANATQTKQTYTITGTDENGNTADYRFKIEVRKLVLSGTQAGYSVGAGDALSISPTHSGGIGAVSYSISPAPSELPGGVSFNAETGAISGTPSLEFAEKAFTVTATDSANPPQTAGYSVSIRVNPSAKAPRVSISAGSGVTEGAGAGFTVTAVPAPSAPLAVTVTVTQDGDYGATTGSRTVTIPTSGSATLTISTTDDNADEPNGSVSVTVDAGETYSVSATQTAATVSVADNDEAPGPEVSVTAGSGITEGGDARFTVSASPAPSAPLAVSVTVSQDGDYGATTGSRTVTIPTSGSATLTISTTDDNADETDGSVSVAVDAGEGYTVSGAQGTASVSVVDNDDPPAPEVNISGSAGGEEGADVTFTLSASPAPSAPLAVSVTVAASGDFGVSAGSQTVTIPTSGSATLTVSTTDDDADEPNGSVTLTLNPGDGYSVGALSSDTASVLDNDDAPLVVTPEVSVTAGAGVTEGQGAVFTIAASPAPSAPLAVTVTVSQDGDYGATTGSQTVTIPTSGSATLTVSTTNDNADETDGSVSVAVDTGDGYTVSTAQGTATVNIADNDDPPPATPEVSVTAGSGITEGGDAQFTIAASPAPSAPLAVTVTVTQDGDYGATTGSQTVTIPTTGSTTLTVSTTDDNNDETDGSVSVTVDAGDGYTVSTAQGTATVNTTDNDDPPAPEVSVTAGSGITEGGDAQFTIAASPAPSAPLAVTVTVTQDGDYGATTGTQTVTIPTSGSTTLTVSTTDDNNDETDGSVSVTVDTGDGYTVSTAQGTASVNIADNDDPPPTDAPEVSISDASIVEGVFGFLSVLEFQVTLSRAMDEDITVRYVIRPGTAIEGVDYWPGGIEVTIRAGFTWATIGANVKNDRIREGDETLFVEITGADGAVIAADNTATGTIVDDD